MDHQSPRHGEHGSITGQYVGVEIDGVDHRIYYEENGPEDGIPLLCQHTAGAHGQQWRHLLTDEELLEDYRVIVHDLPFHGKSLPPTTEEWWKSNYELTAERFTESIVSFSDAIDLDNPIYMGCSMGGHIILELIDWYPEEFRAIIGLESGAYTPDKAFDWLCHPEVNTTETAAYQTWGLMAPQSPEELRREVMHMYEQGSNGLLKGDLHFYSVDHDYREDIEDLEPECPVYIMNGEYDWSTDPSDGREVAEGLGEKATFSEMSEVGHFPMSENPALFTEYLKVILEDFRGEDVEIPDVLTAEDVGMDPQKPTAD